jgi:hypothetical protein
LILELLLCWATLIACSGMVGATVGAIRGRATVGGWHGVLCGPAGWILVLTMRPKSER